MEGWQGIRLSEPAHFTVVLAYAISRIANLTVALAEVSSQKTLQVPTGRSFQFLDYLHQGIIQRMRWLFSWCGCGFPHAEYFRSLDCSEIY